jgi:hypothetical protein
MSDFIGGKVVLRFEEHIIDVQETSQLISA